MTSTGRVARLTALALATGTLVAAGAGTAGAATSDKTTFTATGGGSVIRLTVNLPAQLAPVTGAIGLPQTLTQDIVLTGGAVRTSDLKAIATSTLGANGNVPALSALLDKSVVAEFGKPAPKPYSLLPQEVKDGLAGFGINVKALELNSSANNPTVDGAVSHSLSTVTDLTVGDGTGVLNQLLDALGQQVTAILNTALGTQSSSQTAALGGVTAPVTGTVTGLLGQVTDQLNALTQNQTKPLSDAAKQAVQQVVDQLNALPNVLSQKLTAAAADTSLLHIGLIESEQAVDRAAGVVTSTSSNKLVGVSVLGGLVTVDGLSSAATAALGNGVSQATADKGQNAILKVNVKDVLTATLGSGLGVDLTSNVLPPAVVSTVQGALNTVTGLLNGVLGATLAQTKVGSIVETPNHAASSVSAAELVVKPTLPGVGAVFGDKPLLDVAFVPAEADVVKGEAATPPTVVTTPAKAAQHQFAPTGANFGLTAPIAIGLMGLAVVARRRRLAHLG
jgi:hypothetical protein